MRASTFIACVAAIVVCILIIEPNMSEATSKHKKIKIAKKLAGLLLLSGHKKVILPLPLPLPLPIPIFKSHQPIIIHEPIPFPIHGHLLHGLKGGLGGGFGGIGGGLGGGGIGGGFGGIGR